MKSSFSDLGIAPPILKALEAMGFEAPTEVQQTAIPHVLHQEDLIVKSKTGSGKTAVFGVPILQMTDPQAQGPQCLILTPTRELAVQVDNDLKSMAKNLSHKTAAVYGQHNMALEIESLQKGISIVTGTPGRVFDHIRQGNLKTKHIHFLVLDEADRMLDMGFIDQVVKIIKTVPRNRVTLLFSATIPTEIQRICRDFMKRPSTIEIESKTATVETTEQYYYRVNNNEKITQLNRILLMERPESCMIFCNTRIKVDKVQGYLARKGYASKALHGDIPQTKRLKTIQQFKRAEFPLLIATDVAARGIHVDELSLVINYDVPLENDGYIHRIGRTGRAGHGGKAITLVTSDDIMSLYEIEEHIGAMIEEAEWPSEAEFNRNRAEAEKWIQTQRVAAPRLDSPTGSADEPKKKSRPRRKKPAGQQPRHREKPVPEPAAARTKDADAVRSAPQRQPESARVKPAASSPPKQPEPARVKPVVSSPPNQPEPVPTEPHRKVVQEQSAPVKKPLLKRVMQRILGKQ
ncbi:MAG: DEAD/DEAH box helicase [Syntrophomonas sp.]